MLGEDDHTDLGGVSKLVPHETLEFVVKANHIVDRMEAHESVSEVGTTLGVNRQIAMLEEATLALVKSFDQILNHEAIGNVTQDDDSTGFGTGGDQIDVDSLGVERSDGAGGERRHERDCHGNREASEKHHASEESVGGINNVHRFGHERELHADTESANGLEQVESVRLEMANADLHDLFHTQRADVTVDAANFADVLLDHGRGGTHDGGAVAHGRLGRQTLGGRLAVTDLAVDGSHRRAEEPGEPAAENGSLRDRGGVVALRDRSLIFFMDETKQCIIYETNCVEENFVNINIILEILKF